MHYHELIRKYGALNGHCSYITESKHRKAVKAPYKRSSHFNALAQMLVTNQRLDKIGAYSVQVKAHGMLDDLIWAGHVEPPGTTQQLAAVDKDNNDDDDGGVVDDREIIGEVKLARNAGE